MVIKMTDDKNIIDNSSTNKNKETYDFSKIDYSPLLSFLQKEFFSVIEETSVDQISGDVSLLGANTTFGGGCFSRNFTSGARLDLLVKPVYSTGGDDFTKKMFAPSGLSFEFLYRNFLVPQPSKDSIFYNFAKRDSGVKLLNSIVSANNRLYSHLSKNKKKISSNNLLSAFPEWDFDSSKTFKKPYYFSLLSVSSFESDLIPFAYLLKDVDNFISSVYRDYNVNKTQALSSINSVFLDSFERKHNDFKNGIGKVLSQYVSGEKK